MPVDINQIQIDTRSSSPEVRRAAMAELKRIEAAQKQAYITSQGAATDRSGNRDNNTSITLTETQTSTIQRVGGLGRGAGTDSTSYSDLNKQLEELKKTTAASNLPLVNQSIKNNETLKNFWKDEQSFYTELDTALRKNPGAIDNPQFQSLLNQHTTSNQNYDAAVNTNDPAKSVTELGNSLSTRFQLLHLAKGGSASDLPLIDQLSRQMAQADQITNSNTGTVANLWADQRDFNKQLLNSIVGQTNLFGGDSNKRAMFSQFVTNSNNLVASTSNVLGRNAITGGADQTEYINNAYNLAANQYQALHLAKGGRTEDLSFVAAQAQDLVAWSTVTANVYKVAGNNNASSFHSEQVALGKEIMNNITGSKAADFNTGGSKASSYKSFVDSIHKQKEDIHTILHNGGNASAQRTILANNNNRLKTLVTT